MRAVFRAAVAAAALWGALLTPVSAARAQAAPKHLLYRATGPNGATVYLLGSVHLLSESAGTLPAVVDSAFAHARVIAFEASLDTLEMRAPELLGAAQLAGGATLRGSLSPAGASKLDGVLSAYGLTTAQVNRFKPWFVALLLSQVAMQRMHFQPQYGVDMQLNARAHAANKTIVGLEPVDVQLGLFDRISAADQEQMLLATATPEEAVRSMTRIRDAWLAGDAAALDSITRAAGSSPALTELLLAGRTRSWLPRVEALLQGRQDALVVVGAAHLVGAQGLVELLRAKGFRVDQM